MKRLIAIFYVSLLLLSSHALAQTKSKDPSSQPPHIRLAQAADAVAALDLEVAKQIEIDAGKGLFGEDRSGMLEAAKARYGSSNQLTQVANVIRAFPQGHEASKSDPTFDEMCVSTVRVLLAESRIVKLGQSGLTPKLFQLMVRAYNARRAFVKLLLDL